ncbi:AraC family transcriptional regulator [Mariniflexile maritimum]|uniref:AraC family transcriptional regulator n=1 Tax=Mariniflexile maritimum TaxID=2682493 RepID=UPI0012F6CDDD|nr:AraC family transcriptional regulator [Mariniflexile maritimum]
MKAQFEKVPYAKDASFNAFFYENENFAAPWHFHPEFELTYIEKGKGIRYVANSVQKFEESDFVILGANLPHCWKNTANETNHVKSIVFQWDDTVLGNDWLEKEEFKPIKGLLRKASRGIKFSSETAQEMYPELLNIMKATSFQKLMGFIAVLNKLALREDIEFLSSENFTSSLNLKANDRIDKVYHYVHTHFDKKIALSDVSSLVAMGDEAFCRFFKKSLNKSFFTFVNEYRINVACKLLIETSKPVNQIAYDCGYESLPFFYRQFQKFVACSPLKFRSKHSKPYNKAFN